MEALKNDSEKPPMDLLPPVALRKVAQVLGYGAKKYGTWANYKKGRAWRRDAAAVLRHVFSWLEGETKDPESGHNHLAHAVCGLLFLLEYEDTHPEKDDRAPPKGEG